MVVFKTGASLHLDKHLSIAQANGDSQAMSELQAAKERLGHMNFVERFRVVAVAYRE